MFDLNNLVGIELNLAKEKLKNEGFSKVSVVFNLEHNEKCDTNIVCAVRQNGEEITLICGEFYLNLKG